MTGGAPDYKHLFVIAIQQRNEVRAKFRELNEEYRECQVKCIEARKLARQYLDALHAMGAMSEVEWLPWEK